MNGVFQPGGHPNTNTRAPFLKLNQPLRNIKHGQKTLSYMALYIWNSLQVSLKTTEGLNTYKRRIKKHFLDRKKNNEINIYNYF